MSLVTPLLKSKQFGKILGYIGTAIGIGLNASAGVLFVEILQKRRLYTEIPESMLFSNIFCNLINLAFGYQKGDTTMITSSGVGTGLAVLWGVLYSFYLAQKKIDKFLLYTFIIINLSAEIFWIFGGIIKPKEIGEAVAGWFAFFLTVINAATPGQNIITVIKTGKYKLIPIVTTVFGFLCSSCWFVYGIWGLDKGPDMKMYIPNGLGILLNLAQILVYIPTYLKNKDRVWPEEETPTAEGPSEGLIKEEYQKEDNQNNVPEEEP